MESIPSVPFMYWPKMQYSDTTLYKLAEMQYRTFQAGRRSFLVIIATAFLFIGFYFGINSTFGIITLFIGCILITGINTRPRATAKALAAQLSGSYPHLWQGAGQNQTRRYSIRCHGGIQGS